MEDKLASFSSALIPVKEDYGCILKPLFLAELFKAF